MPRHNAPLFLRSAAHVPRRPAPPSLLRSTVSSSTRTLPIRTIAGLRVTRVITCVDLGRYGKRIEGGKEEEEEARKGEGEKTRRAKEERLPKPKPKPANLYLHFALPAVPLVSFTNFTFTATAMATRFASRSPPLLLFSSPLLLASAPVPASRLGRPRKNKPTRTGRGETRAFPIFELARPLLCKHFQGGSRRRKRSLLASNTNTLTMNHRDHRIRPLLPVRG